MHKAVHEVLSLEIKEKKKKKKPGCMRWQQTVFTRGPRPLMQVEQTFGPITESMGITLCSRALTGQQRERLFKHETPTDADTATLNELHVKPISWLFLSREHKVGLG